MKGLPTTLLSVTFTPWYKEPSGRRKKQRKEPSRKLLEEPVMKEEVEGTPEEDPTKTGTKSCYSCGEEGHISQSCLKGDLVAFPIEEVEYDPQEIEALIGMEKSRKRIRLDSRNNPISTKEDLSHITCFRCKDSGLYFSGCPKRKPRTLGGYVITRKPRDLSEVICFRCNEAGNFARDCPNEDIRVK